MHVRTPSPALPRAMRRALLVTLAAAASALAGCHAATVGGPAGHALATLHDASGQAVGTVTFTQAEAGPVTVNVRLNGLPAGTHGIHFHAVGVCDATGATPFGSAGGHFNPAGRQHGLENAAGPHAGDLPNVDVAGDGSGGATFTTDRITLGEGANSVFDTDGTAVVVHAGADDQRSDPAGNAGPRIACGVVTRS